MATIGNGRSSIVRRCTSLLTATTNGSGFYGGVITTSSVTSTQEWSNLAARWSEARVLQIKVHYIDSVSNFNAIVFSTDRSGALTAPTTNLQVWGGDAAKVFNADVQTPQTPKYSARAIDLEDQDFAAVGAMTNNYSIRVGLSGTASTAIAYLFVEYMVEFRGAT